MGNGLDIYTIIFLVLAVVIFFRLRSVLGERTGHEKPPYERREHEKPAEEADNVVPMPGMKRAPQPQQIEDEIELRTFAREGTHLYTSLEKLLEREPSFNPASFLDNAKQAYEMIVMAYANGDKKALADLLEREVYEGFAAAIDQRDEADETLYTDFIGFDSAKFEAVDFEGATALVTVRFESNIITHTKDAEGRIVDGDPSEVVSVIDHWTFSRQIGAESPMWYLASTEYVKG